MFTSRFMDVMNTFYLLLKRKASKDEFRGN